MEYQIEKQIEIKASISKVWQALTNHRQFGEWFRVNLEGPFVVGEMTRGQTTYPGYEHVRFEVCVQKIEPEYFFSYTWHPYAVDPDVDYSKEQSTLVEFKLEAIPIGTLLIVTESGFEKIPGNRYLEAFRMNESGWTEQLQNIKKYVESKS